MAFVVSTKRGTFEIRESRLTPDGPRSRTLATFRELDHETIGKALARAEKALTPEELRAAALKAGAPVASTPVNEAARDLLRLSSGGEQLDPKLRRLVLGSLVGDKPSGIPDHPPAPVSDAAQAAIQWIGTGLTQRGDALWDLLELADAIPIRRRPVEIGFPVLKSA
jgi:hypothetical protein